MFVGLLFPEGLFLIQLSTHDFPQEALAVSLDFGFYLPSPLPSYSLNPMHYLD